MAFMINGFGTRIVGGRGFVNWTGRWLAPRDFDGLECFCLFSLPIIPLHAVHAYAWSASSRERDPVFGPTILRSCRSVPVRWSLDLLLRTYLNSWLGVPAFAAAGLILGGVFGDKLRTPKSWACLAAGLACAAIAIGGWLLLWLTDQRARTIRRVLGPAEVYGSDPVTWPDDQVDEIGTPRELFGTENFTQAVDEFLDACRYARAMLAARLGTAVARRRGKRAAGEALTNDVLSDPGVRRALAEVRHNPQRWYKVMNRKASQAKAARP